MIDQLRALRDELLKSLEQPIKQRFENQKDNEIFDLGLSTANRVCAEKLTAILSSVDIERLAYKCAAAALEEGFDITGYDDEGRAFAEWHSARAHIAIASVLRAELGCKEEADAKP